MTCNAGEGNGCFRSATRNGDVKRRHVSATTTARIFSSLAHVSEQYYASARRRFGMPLPQCRPVHERVEALQHPHNLHRRPFVAARCRIPRSSNELCVVPSAGCASLIAGAALGMTCLVTGS
jgi:hypothetical protein